MDFFKRSKLRIMKILYLWIKEYKVFKCEEFNFDSRYKFKFNLEDQVINAKKNHTYIPNLFYVEEENVAIKDITVIVGNNGVGKSTVMELIMNLNSLKDKLDYVMIYEDSNQKINLVSSKLIKVKLILDTGETILPNENMNDFNNIKFIYHSNILNYRDEFDKDNIFNISTTNLLVEDNKQRNEKITNKDYGYYNRVFFQEELKRQMKFISKFKNNNNYFDFEIPTKIELEFVDFDKKFELILNRIESKEYLEVITEKYGDERKGKNDLDDIYTSLYDIVMQRHDKIIYNDEEQFKVNIIKGFLINILDLIIVKPTSKHKMDEYKYKEQSKEILSIIEKLNRELDEYCKRKAREISYLENVELLIKKLCSLFIKHTAKLTIRHNNLCKFIENFEQYNLSFNSKGKYSIIVNDNNKVIEFYEKYTSILTNYDFISFSWGISSGEHNMLSLFSRFFEIKENKLNECKTKHLTILLDEADLSFHPEWQRNYIKNIISFFNNLYKDYIIHIIITTHSPILLSDIPNENIIYLSKDRSKIKEAQENRTFAANIYKLYKESFYFNNNGIFNTIGKFAEKKISEVQSIIQSLYQNKDCIQNNNTNEKSLYVNILDKEEIEDKLNKVHTIAQKIGEDIIRESILEDYRLLKEFYTYEDVDFKVSNKNKEIEVLFNDLNKEEKEKFIMYILNKYEEE